MSKVKVVCFADTVEAQISAFDAIVKYFKEHNVSKVSVSCNGLTPKTTLHEVSLIDDETLYVFGTSLVSSCYYTIEKKKLANVLCEQRPEILNIAKYLKLII